MTVTIHNLEEYVKVMFVHLTGFILAGARQPSHVPTVTIVPQFNCVF